MSRKQAKRAAFYAELRHIRQDPCYCGEGCFDHDWKFVSDWYGDPEVINGTQDCSYAECKRCGKVDESGESADYFDGLACDDYVYDL